MINSNELRIGNWVSFPFGGQQQVTGADLFDWEGTGGVLPIPITPEILEKACFEYEDMGDDSPYERWVCKDYNELWVWNFNDEEWMFCLGDGFEQGGFHYLHQLQNLYFALSGTELEITL